MDWVIVLFALPVWSVACYGWWRWSLRRYDERMRQIYERHFTPEERAKIRR